MSCNEQKPDAKSDKWTAFCHSELKFLAQCRNNACAVSFPTRINVFMDESEIEVPNFKMDVVLLNRTK